MLFQNAFMRPSTTLAPTLSPAPALGGFFPPWSSSSVRYMKSQLEKTKSKELGSSCLSCSRFAKIWGVYLVWGAFLASLRFAFLWVAWFACWVGWLGWFAWLRLLETRISPHRSHQSFKNPTPSVSEVLLWENRGLTV